MKLQYLGTAAAEGWPALFCECDNCKRAKMAGGRNIRTRSQALIDDTLVIDFPPDTYMHILNNGLDAGHWTGALITHAHSDHFYASDFAMHRPVSRSMSLITLSPSAMTAMRSRRFALITMQCRTLISTSSQTAANRSSMHTTPASFRKTPGRI